MKVSTAAVLMIFSLTSIAEEVVWSEHLHWPPWYYHEGPNAGQGISQLVTAYLADHLKPYGYTKKTLTMNISRLALEFQHPKKLMCAVDLYRTREREKFIHFTEVPSLITYSAGVIYLKAMEARLAPHIDENQHISHTSLLADASLRGGVELNRVYFENQNMYTRDNHPMHIYVHHGENPAIGLMRLLVEKKIDYAFADPLEYSGGLDVMQTLVQKKLPEIAFISLGEIAKYNYSYVGCSKTPAGKHIVDLLSQIIVANKNDPEYVNIFTRYMPANVKGFN